MYVRVRTLLSVLDCDVPCVVVCGLVVKQVDEEL